MTTAALAAPVQTGANDLVSEIAAMAQARSTRRLEHVGAETRLAADLGLKGDAAHAFLDEFAEKYGAHLGMLRFRRFFEEEGFDPLAPALIFWLRRIDRNFARQMQAAEATERDITIAHMARVAEAKTWFDPDAAAKPKPREPHTLSGQIGAGLLSLVPIFLAVIMPAMLVLMLGLAVWSGNWSIVGRNLWLVALMAALSGLQAWIARNSWRAVERKLATGAA